MWLSTQSCLALLWDVHTPGFLASSLATASHWLILVPAHVSDLNGGTPRAQSADLFPPWIAHLLDDLTQSHSFKHLQAVNSQFLSYVYLYHIHNWLSSTPKLICSELIWFPIPPVWLKSVPHLSSFQFFKPYFFSFSYKPHLTHQKILLA